MQMVTSFLPSWDRTKTSSKKGFDKAYAVVDKLGAPINRLSNKVGCEAFWPTTLDKESDKAARILRSFCKDGFYAEEEVPATEGVPKGKQRVVKKIPEKVIQNAVGLAIFTTMRTGLWVSGAGGSGILIARQENGEWSPPSGIMLHTVGLGFLAGVDIYDCVLVINNRKALESFTKLRATLGGEISAVAGPAGVGGIFENDGKWKEANRPVFSYLKSRGLYAGVQVDGTIIIERTDENEKFYGERIGVTDILAGKARHPPVHELKRLMETIKAAEGRSDVDQSLLRQVDVETTPGDAEILTPKSATFGVPEPDDPDPYGVLALEKAGLEIREAGSRSRPESTQFEFNPKPLSPIYRNFHRQSVDTLVTSNRDSISSQQHSIATRSSSDRSQMVDMSTQVDGPISPRYSPSCRSPVDSIRTKEEPLIIEPEDVDYTKIDLGPFSSLAKRASEDFDGTTINGSPISSDSREGRRGSLGSDDESDVDDEEEPVIFEAASAQATIITPTALKVQGGLVNIPKRGPPPPLPPRSSARNSRLTDRSTASSPLKSEFEDVDLNGPDRRSVLTDSRSILTNSRRDSAMSTASSFKMPETPSRQSYRGTGTITMTDVDKENSSSGHQTVAGEQNGGWPLRDEPLEAIPPDAKPPETTTEPASKITPMSKPEHEIEIFHSLPPTPEVQIK